MTGRLEAASIHRRIPVGAEPTECGTHFRVWAPERTRVEVLFGQNLSESHELDRVAGGYFEGLVEEAGPGTRYFFRLDGRGTFPDPASRFQPFGVDGPSEVIDPRSFTWTDASWPGVGIAGQVLYEVHVGTFTQQGAWRAASAHLPALADLGITVIEVMPVAEFPGRFGWGYDGIAWFAPTRLYGTPDDFRSFVDRAHALSMGVVLDVVYNHFGPSGNYLVEFSPYYFSSRSTEWGDAVNFDGEHSAAVREFILANVRYWIQEFHLDGFRVDATQQLKDCSPDNIVAAIAREARTSAGERDVIVVGENEPNHTDYVRAPEAGGIGLDALWNDDFHHAAVVALTGHNQAYYSGFFGAPQELISTLKYGCLYQGQLYYWQRQRRGQPALDLPPAASVLFLENHDQIANIGLGARLHTQSHPGDFRAMTALFLLAPGTPMLFQGQEFGSLSPFFYFADHESELASRVRAGRLKFLSQFPNLTTPEIAAHIPDPAGPATFERSKLSRTDSDLSRRMLALHRDLLRLRRCDPAFQAQQQGCVDGAILAADAFVLRFLCGGTGDRLLLVNLANDLYLPSPPEPLLAPPRGWRWETLWSSENPAYGGLGTPPVEGPDGWRVRGHSAVVLGAVPNA